MATRKAYLLTTRVESERTQFSKGVLESVGFTVIPFMAIPSTSPLSSNKESLYRIYETIAQGDDEWAYVFEDDINLLEPIDLDEIIQYENISQYFFYLGICKDYGERDGISSSNIFIKEKEVFVVSGSVKGAHAIGISKTGATELTELFRTLLHIREGDVLLEEYSCRRPANIVRFDLESYVPGNKGIFFQDINRFKSQIGPNRYDQV